MAVKGKVKLSKSAVHAAVLHASSSQLLAAAPRKLRERRTPAAPRKQPAAEIRVRKRCKKIALQRGMTWTPFELMPLKKRAKFYRDNAALYNDALEAKMREVLTQITRKRRGRPSVSKSEALAYQVEDLKKELATASEMPQHLKKELEKKEMELADQKKALAYKTTEVVTTKKELVKTKKELVKTKKELEKTKTQLVKNEPLRMLGERMWQKLQI